MDVAKASWHVENMLKTSIAALPVSVYWLYWLKHSCGGLSTRYGLRYRHMVELQWYV